ncbi:hypothetical protein [Zhongshania sp.]|uniref:portal protein n=1 Tax=Zhongshania sp. TaxID=1971902 RepID=UPI0035685F9B
MAYDIKKAHQTDNIAEELDDSTLDEIAQDLLNLIEGDEESRASWMDSQGEWMKLAAQVRETKSYPWQNASNVKYPLMTTACMQFHARALPGLINSSQPVLAKVHGSDPTGEKLARASRVRRYMSYQVMEEMDEWMDEMDRLLFVLPMIGLCYKKTYFSDNLGRARSVLVLPKDLVVNYNAQSYDRARLTHILYMDDNEVVEMQREGLFLDIDLTEATYKVPDELRDEIVGLSHPPTDDGELRRVYESHCWLDLDEDGYKEPYIVTIDSDSEKVLRIVARWSAGDVRYNAKGKVSKITPMDFFTPFILLPDPNSAVYGLGFGTLLGPTNEAINTLINQLIDAGTLSNMQGGFLARGLKIKGGATRFKPGEWKIANAPAGEMKNSIVPLPVKEPSSALFNLLSLLINSGERISSVSDMMMGENPGQNQAATTTMAVLEQGLKVFSSIHRRLHRALAKEYKKLYKLNHLHLDEEEYQAFLDNTIPQEMQAIEMEASPEELEAVEQQLRLENAMAGRDDFESDSLDIVPESDPHMVSEAQRIVKSQALLEKVAAGFPINREEALRRALEAEQHEDIDALMTLPPQGPSPEQLEFELEKVKEIRATYDSFFTALEKVAKAESLEEGTQLQTYSSFVKDTIAVMQAEQGGQSGQTGEGGSATPVGPSAG